MSDSDENERPRTSKTPANQQTPVRTTRFSERKKRLFGTAESADDDGFLTLSGVTPLDEQRGSRSNRLRTSISLFKPLDEEETTSTASSRSSTSSSSSSTLPVADEKENLVNNAQLPELFETSMSLSKPAAGRKRLHCSPAEEPAVRKMARIDGGGISTKIFYSAPPATRYASDTSRPALRHNAYDMFSAGSRRVGGSGGVVTKAKRAPRRSKELSQKVRQRVMKRRHSLPTLQLDSLIGHTNCEKLRNLLLSNFAKTANMCGSMSVPAAPTSIAAQSTAGVDETVYFSDVDDDDDVGTASVSSMLLVPAAAAQERSPGEDSVCSAATLPTARSTRKFFKSGCASSTRKVVGLAGALRAGYADGKLSLIQRKIGKPRTSFKSEQSKVDDILKRLDAEFMAADGIEQTELTPAALLARIPYNTNEPAAIEQQTAAANFLIDHDLCSERNFHIFIVDPEHNFEEISAIINRYEVHAENAELFQQRLTYKTDDPAFSQHICSEENFDSLNPNYEQRKDEAQALEDTLAPLAEPEAAPTQVASNSSSPKKLYPIFTEPMRRITLPVSRRRTCANLERGAIGANQYQIDAGQKRYGAQHCQECGLVYSAHEPEDEQLHREYHNSINVLNFHRWTEEEIVADCAEWGKDGRIIRLTECSATRRIQRLKDVLQLVDKELGQSMYQLPNVFIAYLAITDFRIVGICIVQPLTKARKFMSADSIDYCSEQEYPAKCGISRIWVSSLHQRMRIGSKLLEAVQYNAIIGEIVPLTEIAFTAPTEQGKAFAQKLTKTQNFLIYT